MAVSDFDLWGKALPQYDAPVSSALGPSPLRRPGSVRRTSSIDAIWPKGRTSKAAEFFGTARDLLTTAAGDGVVLREDSIHVLVDHRTILAVTSEPPHPELEGLAGAVAGQYLRAAIEKQLPGERKAGTPLYLLLDDLAGATLVAQWAFSVWASDVGEEKRASSRRMEGVCIGFRPGSHALELLDSPAATPHATAVPPLPHPDDPLGWHALVEREDINFRRARLIDLWRSADGGFGIEARFQDSASSPRGGRVAVHEYRIDATADADGRLTAIQAVPGTLPFKECRVAPINIQTMVGVPLAELRAEVLVRLAKTAGCTHLNDMLRALAEVPAMAEGLSAA